MKCTTRNDSRSIRHQCYTNVLDAYTCVSLPHLGRSDHTLVQLTSKYRPLVQKEPIVTRAVKEWSADAVQNIEGALEGTNPDAFVDSASKFNELTIAIFRFSNTKHYNIPSLKVSI